MKVCPFWNQFLNNITDELKGVIDRGYGARLEDSEFDEIMLKVHRHQWERSRALQRLIAAPVSNWHEIPLIPTRLFALHDLRGFPHEETIATFESSGTTRGTRSLHYFNDLSIYRRAALEGARWALGEGPFHVRSLMPVSPRSSLATMIGWIEESFGAESGADRHRRSVLVIGPTFAFVELYDSGHREELPENSIVIETGGYKNRTRNVGRSELHEMIAEMYAIPIRNVRTEYGMCEISSPFWQAPSEPGFRIPGWVRVRTVDPETLDDAPEGVIAIYDPMNFGSTVAILTSDLGHIEDHTVHLHGRVPGSPLKGCGLGLQLGTEG